MVRVLAALFFEILTTARWKEGIFEAELGVDLKGASACRFLLEHVETSEEWGTFYNRFDIVDPVCLDESVWVRFERLFRRCCQFEVQRITNKFASECFGRANNETDWVFRLLTLGHLGHRGWSVCTPSSPFSCRDCAGELRSLTSLENSCVIGCLLMNVPGKVSAGCCVIRFIWTVSYWFNGRTDGAALHQVVCAVEMAGLLICYCWWVLTS